MTSWGSNYVCKPHTKLDFPSARWDDALTKVLPKYFHNERRHVADQISSRFTSAGCYVEFW